MSHSRSPVYFSLSLLRRFSGWSWNSVFCPWDCPCHSPAPRSLRRERALPGIPTSPSRCCCSAGTGGLLYLGEEQKESMFAPQSVHLASVVYHACFCCPFFSLPVLKQIVYHDETFLTNDRFFTCKWSSQLWVFWNTRWALQTSVSS